MIQLIFSGGTRLSPRLKRHCLADPDVLLELGEPAGNAGIGAEEAVDRFSLILHDLRMAGAWKRTNRHRLKQTEKMLCAHIGPQFRHDLLFLDVGASDGITTVEALRALRQTFGDVVRAYVADLNLWLLRYRRGPVVEYRASNGEPVMARVGPLGIRLGKGRRVVAQRDSNLLAELYLGCRRFREAMSLDATISLVNPTSRQEPGLTVIELDCLRREQSMVDRVSAIRASNVLNLGYFEPPQLLEAIGHFHAYLCEGGCLVVSRNIDRPGGETESGSVWIKAPDRFRWVEDFGFGSEIKQLVDDWRPE